MSEILPGFYSIFDPQNPPLPSRHHEVIIQGETYVEYGYLYLRDARRPDCNEYESYYGRMQDAVAWAPRRDGFISSIVKYNYRLTIKEYQHKANLSRLQIIINELSSEQIDADTLSLIRNLIPSGG
jgi:hypothetical protein